jgi:uncharacterized protein (TIGR02145 family)
MHWLKLLFKYSVCLLLFTQQLNAQTLIKVKDIEGNVYGTVKIGNQIWLSQNLRTTQYNDGTSIPNVIDRTEWEKLSYGAYCWNANDSVTYANTYGALYNWETVNTDKLCPIGWHVPTQNEWSELINFISAKDNSGDEGTSLKSKYGWINDGNGTDNYNFLALPSGYRYGSGYFREPGVIGSWWSINELDGSELAKCIGMKSYRTDISIDNEAKSYGLSVRCLKDMD